MRPKMNMEAVKMLRIKFRIEIVFGLVCLAMGFLTLSLSMADKIFLKRVFDSAYAANQPWLLSICPVVGIPAFLALAGALMVVRRGLIGWAFFGGYAVLISLNLLMANLFSQIGIEIHIFNTAAVLFLHIIITAIGSIYVFFFR